MKLLSSFGIVLSACLATGMQRHESRASTAISIAAFKFAPTEVTVSVGDTVAWTNDDAFRHTTTADSGAWASAELATGQRFLFVATRAGRFPYHCSAHLGMRAVLHVRE
jgi:plastocyanin